MAMKVPVEEYTTPDPITATEDMSIDQLQILMDEFGVRHLPILRDGKVVGMVSDRDVRIARGLSEAEKFLICAGDIMAADPVTVRATWARISSPMSRLESSICAQARRRRSISRRIS